MSHIIQNENGVQWDVYLTALHGDPTSPQDNQLVGRSRSLAGAAILLLEAMDKQAREAFEEEQAYIERLESGYVGSQIAYLSALNKSERLEQEQALSSDASVFPSFGFQGGRA